MSTPVQKTSWFSWTHTVSAPDDVSANSATPKPQQLVDTFERPLRNTQNIRNGSADLSWVAWFTSWFERAYQMFCDVAGDVKAALTSKLAKQNSREERWEFEVVEVLEVLRGEGTTTEVVEREMKRLQWTDLQKATFRPMVETLRQGNARKASKRAQKVAVPA